MHILGCFNKLPLGSPIFPDCLRLFCPPLSRVAPDLQTTSSWWKLHSSISLRPRNGLGSSPFTLGMCFSFLLLVLFISRGAATNRRVSFDSLQTPAKGARATPLSLSLYWNTGEPPPSPPPPRFVGPYSSIGLRIMVFSLVGFKRNLSLLDIFLFCPISLNQGGGE